MLKCWQTWCEVPLKSFHIELVASEFILQSPWRSKSWFYFDWLVRDFFAFLYQRADGFVFVHGTSEALALGDAWQSRAMSAYRRAVKAWANSERDNLVQDAGNEWQKIFGTSIPLIA